MKTHKNLTKEKRLEVLGRRENLLFGAVRIIMSMYYFLIYKQVSLKQKNKPKIKTTKIAWHPIT